MIFSNLLQKTRSFFGKNDYTMQDFVSTKIIELPDTARFTVERLPEQYLGHPDILLNQSGDVIALYPKGHGRGEIIKKISHDFGKTWSERLPTNSSWEKSQETPTIYNLDMSDGSKKIIVISGLPGWHTSAGAGFQSSVSIDDGATFTEFKRFYDGYEGVVAMASLTQLMENGKFVDKWMGLFHDYSYNNYSTILTFKDGVEEWSAPITYLKKYREIEKASGMCEIEVLRTPDLKTLILIARSNKKRHNSMISFSYDEGINWTEPKEVCKELTGERHKAEYDPITKKLIISFRHMGIVKEAKSKRKRIYFGNWTAWLGTFEDLLSYQEADVSKHKKGEGVILLGKEYGGKADTGYAGTTYKDGEFLCVSYGRFDDKATLPYIMAVKFNLSKMGKN